MGISAYYEFEILSAGSIRYEIRPIKKVGNHELFNKVFRYYKKLWVHKVSSQFIENHVGFIIGTSVGIVSWLPISLQSTTFSFPFGIVKSVNDEDAILFKIVDYNKFEVYILEGKKYDSINYLQLLVDGHLEAEIEQIKSK